MNGMSRDEWNDFLRIGMIHFETDQLSEMIGKDQSNEVICLEKIEVICLDKIEVICLDTIEVICWDKIELL